jgi:dTDP-4-dehydrorhamnose 3,5-epimerase
MEVIKTKIPDLLVLKPNVFKDERGYFFESFNKALFEKNGLNYDFIQDNESKSSSGVIRGLHYQLAPYAQTKLVRVISGKVLDVAVDLREASPTFGQWHAVELSAENKLQFLVPRGFAHGFAVLEDNTIFAYKCDNLYNKESERGINFNDKKLNIDWGFDIEKAIISTKDKTNPCFDDAEMNFVY